MNVLSPITKKNNVRFIYEQQPVPIFQNKVYDNRQDAITCKKLSVKLYQCLETGFVFNGNFDGSILDYNKDYQNEQGNSEYFQNHLKIVYDLMLNRNLLNGKIIEIGCGKGLFLDVLKNKGHQVIGVDPTYEGDSDCVIKEYYSEKHKNLEAEFIVLRHTLEHIAQPYDFLRMIADANKPETEIYIEIPTFEWIYNNNAVEDVFYEHCNYFTKKSIKSLFKSCDVNYIFNDQYIGVFAKLGELKKPEEIQKQEIEDFPNLFQDAIQNYEFLLKGKTRKMIWGAGAKGSTFLNLMDKKGIFFLGVIDINSKKQNKFIGGTGHEIFSPKILNEIEVDEIVISNSNYFNEIKKTIFELGLNIELKVL